MIFYCLVRLINFFKKLSVSGMLFEVQCSNGVSRGGGGGALLTFRNSSFQCVA